MKRSPKLGKLWLSHYVYGDGQRAAWFVVRDPMAGKKHVYTVYRITLFGSNAATIIGRELPLPLARKIVQKDRDSFDWEKSA